MTRRRIYTTLMLLAVVSICATFALAQPATLTEVPVKTTAGSWQAAQLAGATDRKIVVITVDQPERRQSCRVQAFAADKLVCSHFGHSRTYLPQQILALIVPGDHALKIRLVLGFNAGLGASVWATVVLAATCPACAAATGVAALFFFGAAGALLMGDEQPDRLLYLAEGRHLTGKLHVLESQPFAGRY